MAVDPPHIFQDPPTRCPCGDRASPDIRCIRCGLPLTEDADGYDALLADRDRLAARVLDLELGLEAGFRRGAELRTAAIVERLGTISPAWSPRQAADVIKAEFAPAGDTKGSGTGG